MEKIKNIVFVDIDSEREEIVKIGKTPDFKVPDKGQEDFDICQMDNRSFIEGVLKIGMHIDSCGYQAIEDTVDDAIKQLKEGLEEFKEGQEKTEEKEEGQDKTEEDD